MSSRRYKIVDENTLKFIRRRTGNYNSTWSRAVNPVHYLLTRVQRGSKEGRYKTNNHLFVCFTIPLLNKQLSMHQLIYNNNLHLR